MDIDLATLPRARLQSMLAAGEEIAECCRVLKKGGLTVVGEMLKAQGQFIKLNHYPKGDVFDPDSYSQYYYHAHRPEEHGHFHTFLRQPGMPESVEPVPEAASREWPKGDKALSHLIAISMDRFGNPIGLFTTNRWVTGETWYKADDVCVMLDRFVIDHAYPSWPTNRWITAMVRLFRPQIEVLIRQRDTRLQLWAEAHPEVDVFEDRQLETISETSINVDEQMADVRQALSGSRSKRSVEFSDGNRH